MSSTNLRARDTLTAMEGVNRVLTSVWQGLEGDKTAVPDMDDVLESATWISAVSENLLKLNAVIANRAAVGDGPCLTPSTSVASATTWPART